MGRTRRRARPLPVRDRLRRAAVFVMVAAAGWFQQLMACPGPQRVQILDEAWALLGNRHRRLPPDELQAPAAPTASPTSASPPPLTSSHRPTTAPPPAKIAAGLLADSATRSSSARPRPARRRVAHFGLTGPKRPSSASSPRSALWKLGGRTAVVQHVLGLASSPSSTPTPRRNGPTERTEAA